jgi:DUF4097 and DUF4098 domain-containing protein YvlB
LEKVSQAVTVDARGTQLTVRGLGSSLKATTSYRPVKISDVAGDVSLDSRYSTLVLKDIKGAVGITSDSDQINAEDLSGRLTVKAQRSGVSLDTVDGAVDIRTTLKDVTVNNFRNGCTITNEYADVSLSTGVLGTGDTTVNNRNGSIDVFLPEGAGFEIDAAARNGRVDSSYPGLQPLNEGDKQILRGRTKDGGPRIRLETEYGDIHLQPRGAERVETPRTRGRFTRRQRFTDITR